MLPPDVSSVFMDLAGRWRPPQARPKDSGVLAAPRSELRAPSPLHIGVDADPPGVVSGAGCTHPLTAVLSLHGVLLTVHWRRFKSV